MPRQKTVNSHTTIGASNERPVTPGTRVSTTGCVFASANTSTRKNKKIRKMNESRRIVQNEASLGMHVYPLAQILAGLEMRNPLFGHAHLGTRFWIAAHTRRTV